ncbi:ketopantoate reductase-like protein [Trametopsis cervina]|nr:ketopantoate reductase-like protein [Trametopsis cervina]
MHTHIIGLGPIGSLVANHLRRALPPSHLITLLHKDETRCQRAQWENKINIECNGTVHTASGFRHEIAPLTQPIQPGLEDVQARFRASRASDPPIRSLVVCLKTQQTLGALGSLYTRITPETTIVLLQNGMGTLEVLLERLFKKPQFRPNFVLGTTTHGAWYKSYLHAVHAGVGDIALGVVPREGDVDYEQSRPYLSLDDIAPNPLASGYALPPPDDSSPDARRARQRASLRETMDTLLAVNALNVSWKSMDEVLTLVRRKLVVNSVLNPLTTIFECPNGGLFEHHEARGLARRICIEASTLFHAQHEQDRRAAQFAGEDEGYKPFPPSLGPEKLYRDCTRMADLTAMNYSSMLMDWRKGALHSEVQSLNGYLVHWGKKFGLGMGANRMLCELVKLKMKIRPSRELE